MRHLLLALAVTLASVAHAQPPHASDTAQAVIPPHDHQDGPLLKIQIGLASGIGGMDIATTTQAEERGGFSESNVLYGRLFDEPALLGLVNGAATGGIIYMAVQWHRSENVWKRRTAQILLPVWIAFRGYAVYNNWDLLRDHPK